MYVIYIINAIINLNLGLVHFINAKTQFRQSIVRVRKKELNFFLSVFIKHVFECKKSVY